MKNKLDEHVKAYEGSLLYDFDNRILLNWYPKRIIELNSDPDLTVLELGLGHGFTAQAFSSHYRRHVVLEGSSAVIKNYLEQYPKSQSHIIETLFETFQSDEKFDIIVLGFILEHVDDPILVLNHYRQFLTDKGLMFVAVPNAEVLNRRLGHVAGLLDDMQILSDNDLLLGHQRYYTVDTLTQDIVDSGYQLDQMEGIYLKPFTTSQILSLGLDENIIRALCEVGIDYPELSCGLMAQIKAIPAG